MKSKKIYVCSNCGYSTSKWLGQCPDCECWNTLLEEYQDTTASKEVIRADAKKPVLLSNVNTNDEVRFDSKIAELDRVLGGGIVQGSVVLISGEPGIGKSTLLLQICNTFTDSVLYVSGEESPSQIKLRAKRLGIKSDSVNLLCDTNLENIADTILDIKPKVAIIDSVQTISSSEVSSSPGTVSQIRTVTLSLMKLAKSTDITIFIVGHVTKDGNIAGPKILEHMVDCVLYFEGENTHSFRLLRAAKNRFGPTNEVGIFEMTDYGLESVTNPSGILINDDTVSSSGTCIVCTMEGTRPIISEVQALATPTFFPIPKRTASGVDYNRVTLLLAVLEKATKISISNFDVYVNIAGGMKLKEPASDLAIILAIYSAYKDKIIDRSTIVFGEIGLLGEIRPVSFVESRIKETLKLGYKKIIVPYTNYKKLRNAEKNVIPVKNVSEAIKAILS